MLEFVSPTIRGFLRDKYGMAERTYLPQLISAHSIDLWMVADEIELCAKVDDESFRDGRGWECVRSGVIEQVVCAYRRSSLRLNDVNENIKS